MSGIRQMALHTASVVAFGATAAGAALEIYDLDDMALFLQFSNAGAASGSLRFNWQGSKDGTNFFDIVLGASEGAGNSSIINLHHVFAFNDANYATGRIIGLNTFADHVNFLMHARPLQGVRYARLQAINNSNAGNLTCTAELWGRKTSSYA